MRKLTFAKRLHKNFLRDKLRGGFTTRRSMGPEIETGSYLRLKDSCITQLKAQGPSSTCNESKEQEEEINQKLPDPFAPFRCRTTSAQVRHSRPDSGLGVQVEVGEKQIAKRS